jgi:hypothetical protein
MDIIQHAGHPGHPGQRGGYDSASKVSSYAPLGASGRPIPTENRNPAPPSDTVQHLIAVERTSLRDLLNELAGLEQALAPIIERIPGDDCGQGVDMVEPSSVLDRLRINIAMSQAAATQVRSLIARLQL